MPTLQETLRLPAKLDAIVLDASALIDDEVRDKGGLRGMALKAGYRTVKAIRPGIIDTALRRLLPEFAPAVDPWWLKACASGEEPVGYFRANASPIAEALLAVTDRRAARADNRVLQRAYAGLRSQAKGHVEDALPRVAALIGKHLP